MPPKIYTTGEDSLDINERILTFLYSYHSPKTNYNFWSFNIASAPKGNLHIVGGMIFDTTIAELNDKTANKGDRKCDVVLRQGLNSS